MGEGLWKKSSFLPGPNGLAGGMAKDGQETVNLVLERQAAEAAPVATPADDVGTVWIGLAVVAALVFAIYQMIGTKASEKDGGQNGGEVEREKEE